MGLGEGVGRTRDVGSPPRSDRVALQERRLRAAARKRIVLGCADCRPENIEIRVRRSERGERHWAMRKQTRLGTALLSALVTFGLLATAGAAVAKRPRHAFEAHMNHATAMTADPVRFDNSAQLVGRGWDSSSSTFTAPVSGYYQFNVTAALDTPASVSQCFYTVAVEVAGSSSVAKHVLDTPRTHSTNVNSVGTPAWAVSGRDLNESGSLMVKVFAGQEVRAVMTTGNSHCRESTTIEPGSRFSGFLVYKL